VAEFFTRRNQWQWLGLLAVAVLLPTISLLWFMSRVIANERLVVPQKLAAIYKDKRMEATTRTEALYERHVAAIDLARAGGNPYPLFRELVLEQHVEGLVVWDEDGRIVYPRRTAVIGGSDVSRTNPLADAWHLEFARRNYAAAAQLYETFSDDADPQVAIAALMGQTRCLSRMGKFKEAIETCQKASTSNMARNVEPETCLMLQNSRLLLLSLLKQGLVQESNSLDAVKLDSGMLADFFHRTSDLLLNDLYSPDYEKVSLPSDQNLFVARKTLDALEGPFQSMDKVRKETLRKLIEAEELSIAAAEAIRPLGGQMDAFFQTVVAEKPMHGLRHKSNGLTALIFVSDEGMARWFSGYSEVFANSEAEYSIMSPSDKVVAGTTNAGGMAFEFEPLPQQFPGWKTRLYFKNWDVFERTADRQIAVYMWTGFLVIVMILVAGGFATRAVGRQIRLNEMKNDFIATVSHELKTPLASMRVLVDTLLEGNVKDEGQVKQYLQLTARENERLSRMIDNFLTFSRMERNKVAFSLADAKPELIANDALESVQTKFATHNCHLSVDIAKDLPEIQADHDAMVTVLVNLLDNACKYTGEDKRIALRVVRDGDAVCFIVEDNGIGLARRHHRRIFERFYQVDSSLARKAEGCGLGLSIVKFIVDAHYGNISVESKPGEGSAFAVRIPIGHGNAV
jgi:signal transduction histidine kinase